MDNIPESYKMLLDDPDAAMHWRMIECIMKNKARYRRLKAVISRENVVLSGSLTSACYIGTDKLEMGVQGWYAVDAESGIISNQAYTTKISLRSKGTTTTVESVNCSIDGILSKPRTQSPAGTGSAEQRLIELRSLFEKGLIGSEHFKKKQAEIVNGL